MFFILVVNERRNYLQVMFKFERLVAFCAFEFPKDRALVVADHVPLEPVNVGEGFITDLAGLEREKAKS